MMIKIENLKEKDKGRKVIYNGHAATEEGYISSWNDKYVFVDYGKNCGRGIATDPKDLDFTFIL